MPPRVCSLGENKTKQQTTNAKMRNGTLYMMSALANWDLINCTRNVRDSLKSKSAKLCSYRSASSTVTSASMGIE